MSGTQSSNVSRGIKSTPQWLTLAIGSGAFAATNGVFAKLTTASHTHAIAAWISKIFGHDGVSSFVEVVCRAAFFGLNILSNIIMWLLFTRALAAATSATRVAILNTSANFMVTAVLGWLIFSEALPLQWWFGACLMAAGSVVIGAREEKEQNVNEDEGGLALNETTAAVALGAGGVVENVAAQGRYRDDDNDDYNGAEDDYDDEQEHGVLAGPGVDIGHNQSESRVYRD